MQATELQLAQQLAAENTYTRYHQWVCSNPSFVAQQARGRDGGLFTVVRLAAASGNPVWVSAIRGAVTAYLVNGGSPYSITPAELTYDAKSRAMVGSDGGSDVAAVARVVAELLGS